MVSGCCLANHVQPAEGVGLDDLLPHVAELAGSKVGERAGHVFVLVPVVGVVGNVLLVQLVERILVVVGPGCVQKGEVVQGDLFQFLLPGGRVWGDQSTKSGGILAPGVRAQQNGGLLWVPIGILSRLDVVGWVDADAQWQVCAGKTTFVDVVWSELPPGGFEFDGKFARGPVVESSDSLLGTPSAKCSVSISILVQLMTMGSLRESSFPQIHTLQSSQRGRVEHGKIVLVSLGTRILGIRDRNSHRHVFSIYSRVF